MLLRSALLQESFANCFIVAGAPRLPVVAVAR
jgi:hypothetical protein